MRNLVDMVKKTYTGTWLGRKSTVFQKKDTEKNPFIYELQLYYGHFTLLGFKHGKWRPPLLT